MSSHLVIVGAQRSGTTYLYQLLNQHPDICMALPIRPEPKFFLSEDSLAQGRDGYLRKYFGHRRDERVLGEKSTSYIERIDAIPRIRRVLPGAHIVFLLRDPALRAYSNWRFSRAHGVESLDFAAALAAEPERSCDWDREKFSVCPFAYAARGHYIRYLDAWLQHFPREQITILTSESVFAAPDTVRDLFGKVSVDPHVPLHPQGRVNAAAGDEEAGVDGRILAALRERYRDDSMRLARDWNLDIGPWQA